MASEWDLTDKEMLLLSFLAMNGFWNKDPNQVARDVKDIVALMAPLQKMVWGPAVHQPKKRKSGEAEVTDALMFMSKKRTADEYTVVIRGTNPFSAMAWITQDFMVGRQKSWNSVSPFAQTDSGKISVGTANAVGIHSTLTPETGFECEGIKILDAIIDILTQAKKSVTLNFTGHSLGGLMAPTFALWVFDQLHQNEYKELLPKANFFVYGFAGPTAGNGEFLAYNRTSLPNIRTYHNPKDIAPLAWNKDSMKTLKHLYDPIKMRWLLKILYEICKISIKNKGYQQFQDALEVPSNVIPNLLYIVEAGYQHTVPYLEILDPLNAKKIQDEIFTPLKAMSK